MEPILIVMLVIIALPLLWLIFTFNHFVKLKNHCTEAWSNIDTELKRRYELIPNLVNTVKGYATHEQDLLEEVTRLRDRCAGNNDTPGMQAITENMLIGALSKLLVRVEAYPDLKAGENFLALQQELANTEDRIQAARRFYNGNVRENNNLVETFPSNIVAGMFGYGLKEFFEVESVAVRQVPEVKL